MVSIAVLVATGIKFEWYEALAIVQETCGLITESADRPASSTLGPETIFIEPSGLVVTSTAAQNPAAAVQHMGTLLKALLPAFHARATFHEVIDRATATPPGYASIAELSRALSPFERPNRAGIVKGVYSRWTKMAGEPAASTAWGFTAQDVAAIDEPEPEEPGQPANQLVPAEKRKRRVARIVAVAAGAVVVLAAGVFALTMRRPAVQATPAPQAEAQAQAPGMDIPLEPDRSKATSAGLSTRSVIASRNAAREATNRDRALEDEVEQIAHRGTDIPDVAAGSIPRTLEVPLSNSPRAGSRAAEIFDAGDFEVTGPTPMYPQQLGRIPAGTRPEDVGLIEVVVNESGTVDSVRVIDAPRSLDDALVMTMSLSAVKSWHFHPAVRNGERVKYRERIRVAMR